MGDCYELMAFASFGTSGFVECIFHYGYRVSIAIMNAAALAIGLSCS